MGQGGVHYISRLSFSLEMLIPIEQASIQVGGPGLVLLQVRLFYLPDVRAWIPIHASDGILSGDQKYPVAPRIVS